MNRFFSKSLSIAFLAACALSVAAPAQAQIAADCSLPTQPIVPDGNVASMDELVAAQKAIGAYQGNLGEYRNCLLEAEQQLDAESEEHEVNQMKITQLYDASVDAEAVTAEKFNQSVRAYNARNPKSEE